MQAVAKQTKSNPNTLGTIHIWDIARGSLLVNLKKTNSTEVTGLLSLKGRILAVCLSIPKFYSLSLSLSLSNNPCTNPNPKNP